MLILEARERILDISVRKYDASLTIEGIRYIQLYVVKINLLTVLL